MGFEITVPVNAQPKTIHDLNCAVNAIYVCGSLIFQIICFIIIWGVVVCMYHGDSNYGEVALPLGGERRIIYGNKMMTSF